jgi:hypothetical protein
VRPATQNAEVDGAIFHNLDSPATTSAPWMRRRNAIQEQWLRRRVCLEGGETSTDGTVFAPQTSRRLQVSDPDCG